MRYLILYGLLCMCAIGLPQDAPVAGTMHCTLSGTVRDPQGLPLAYATALLISGDGQNLDGGITDNKGNFNLAAEGAGLYRIKLQCIGMKDTVIGNVIIEKGQRQVFVGTVFMKPSEIEIDQVTITGRASRMEQKMDKKIYYAGKDAGSATGNASDILAKAPSVQVGIDGELSLRGDANVILLIDNKPVAHNVSEMLNSLPASHIDRIEIITNPSARYQAEGGGIINIILKKNKTQGTSGFLDLALGLDDKYMVNAKTSVSKKTLSCHARLLVKDYVYLTESNRYREAYTGDSSDFFTDYFERRESRKNNQAGVGIVYNPSKMSLGLDLSFWEFGLGRIKKGNQHLWTAPSSNDVFTLNHNFYNIQWDNYDADGFLDWKIDSSQSLQARAYYSRSYGDVTYQVESWDADENKNSLGGYGGSKSMEHAVHDFYRMQADYHHKLTPSLKVEGGLLFDCIRQDHYNNLYNPGTMPGNWTKEPGNLNQMDARNILFAGYASVQQLWHKFEWQAGLRGEQTYRLIHDLTNDIEYPYNHFGLFPSFSFTYKFNEKYSCHGSFSRRVDRPEPWQMIPFRYNYDIYYKVQGNPALKPSYAEKYELGMNFIHNKQRMGLAFFYNHSSQPLWRLLDRFGTYYLYHWENLKREDYTGLEINTQHQLAKWLAINLNASFMDVSIKGNKDQYKIDGYGYTYNANLEMETRLSKKMTVQFAHFLLGPYHVQFIEYDKRYYATLSIKYKPLKNMSVSARFEDVFHNRVNHSVKSVWEDYTQLYSRSQKQVFIVGVSYNFNNYREMSKKDMQLKKGAL
jgi:hypothetical protein